MGNVHQHKHLKLKKYTRKFIKPEPYAVILTVYISALVIAQVLASKLTAIRLPLVGLLTFTGGEIAYCLTFPVTDVVSEIWGKRRANMTVMCGLIANILILVLIYITLLLPPAPYWNGNTAFNAVVSMTARIIIASIVAFLASQFFDVWMFHLLKDLTRDRFLWLRNNVATVLAQTIDTTIFTVIAFYSVAPVLPLIIGQLTVKVILAALDTAPVYLIVGAIRRHLARQADEAAVIEKST